MIDLPKLAKARGQRRSKPLPQIRTTKAQAEQLYREVYAPVVDIWATLTPEMLVPQFNDSVEGGEAVLSAIASRASAVIVRVTPRLRDWTARIETWHRRKFVDGVLTASSVDLSTVLGPDTARTTVQAVIQRNVALVSSVSDDIRARISDAFYRGFTTRATADDIAREITQATGIGRRRARRIAGDQTVKLSATLDAERQREVGLDEWIWRWSHKVHGRPEHIARDGKHYTDKTAPEDLPGQLPFCGCVRQAYLNLDD